jgi:hypothetical protein
MQKTSITISIILDGEYWTALFERREEDGYSVAKATISVKEPNNHDVYMFLKKLNRNRLQFTIPIEEAKTTKIVKVEKRQKFEQKFLEIPLKNQFGQAKTILQKQKQTNKSIKKQQEHKNKVLTDKRIQKKKGK